MDRFWDNLAWDEQLGGEEREKEDQKRKTKGRKKKDWFTGLADRQAYIHTPNSTNHRLFITCFYTTIVNLAISHFSLIYQVDYILKCISKKMNKKYLPLPRSVAKETVLEVLHNHGLLIQTIWSYSTIMSSEARSNETTAIVKTLPTGNVKITYTNIDDGVSLLQELQHGISFLTRWTVTKTARRVKKSGIWNDELCLGRREHNPEYTTD